MKKRLLGIHIGREADNFSAGTSDEEKPTITEILKIQTHEHLMTGYSVEFYVHARYKQETNAVELFILLFGKLYGVLC